MRAETVVESANIKRATKQIVEASAGSHLDFFIRVFCHHKKVVLQAQLLWGTLKSRSLICHLGATVLLMYPIKRILYNISSPWPHHLLLTLYTDLKKIRAVTQQIYPESVLMTSSFAIIKLRLWNLITCILMVSSQVLSLKRLAQVPWVSLNHLVVMCSTLQTFHSTHSKALALAKNLT